MFQQFGQPARSEPPSGALRFFQHSLPAPFAIHPETRQAPALKTPVEVKRHTWSRLSGPDCAPEQVISTT